MNSNSRIGYGKKEIVFWTSSVLNLLVLKENSDKLDILIDGGNGEERDVGVSCLGSVVLSITC